MANGTWRCDLHNLDFDSAQKFAAHKRHHHPKRKKKMIPKFKKHNGRKKTKEPKEKEQRGHVVVLNFCPFCGNKLPNAHIGG